MKYIPVVKVPATYTPQQKKELQQSVELAVRQHRPIVVPDDVEIYSLPIDD
jgi:hypothetical protein